MPKQEYKILEFHGGTNNKFDPRDIAENQNAFSQLSIRNPGRLTLEGSALSLYSKTGLNPLTITSITSDPPGYVPGYGLFSFSHDYDLDPSEVDTDFIVSNDKTSINIYDPNKSGGAGWYSLNGGNAKFTLGSRDGASYPVKPVYYNVDGALRACDSEFRSLAKISTGLLTNKNPHLKSDVVLTTDSGTIATGSIIQINNEIMYVTSGSSSSTSITVIRGYANTKITQHADDSTIYYANVPKFFGHIGGSDFKRLAECDTPLSVNAWVEDVQTPQPPNNTRMGDGTTGVLASSAGVQSLRIYDIKESSTANYPAEPEKVVVEFGEAPFGTGITNVQVNDDTVTFTTSGYGNSDSATNRLQQSEEIVLSNLHDNLEVYNGTHIIQGANDTSFTIANDSGETLDGSGTDFYANATAWVDDDADDEFPDYVEVTVADSLLPFLNSSGGDTYSAYNQTAYVHITGQTGVPAFNGVHRAIRVADNKFRFKTSSHASVGSVAGTTKVQQLIGIVSPEDSGDSINPDIKRKWNFAMSFTYDGPAQEVQESLLTNGYKITPLYLADGKTDNKLAEDLNNSETDVTIDDGSVLTDDVSVIMVGSEQMLVTNIADDDGDAAYTPSTLTVVRGYNGSAKDTHSDNASIYLVTELTPSETVDWTGFAGAPECVIKAIYGHGTNDKTWNPRINGFKIYMRDVTDGDASKEWRLFSHVNFNKGTYTIFAAADSELILEQPASGNIATNTEGTQLTTRPVDTYLSENLFTEDTIIDAQYQCAEVVGRRVYIGNIKQGDRTYPDRMLRTPTNKFDTFPETNYIDVVTGDGDSIIALKSFGDRLLQFKKNAVYVINTSGESEVLEAEYHGNGIKYPSQVVKTNLGIAWINNAGLWLFDGKTATNLTLYLEDNGYAVGTSPTSGAKLGYDKKSNRLVYCPSVSTGLLSPWYIYDIDLKAYQAYYMGILFPYSKSSTNYYTNFINDKDGNLIVGYVDGNTPAEMNFFEWDNTDKGHIVSGLGFLHKTKDIDLGSPGVRKKIYKIYVTYKSSGHSGVKAKYSLNGDSGGGTSFDYGFKDSTYYKETGGGFQSTLDGSDTEWQVAELKPSSSINNAYSIQLSFESTIVAGDVAGSGSSTSVQLASALGSTDYDEYNLYLYNGPGRYNSRRIKSYNTSNQTATVDALTDNGYGNSPTTDTDYYLASPASDFEINDITVVFRAKRIK